MSNGSGDIAKPPSTAASVKSSPGDGFKDIINVVADRADPLLKIVVAIAEGHLKAQQAQARFRAHMAWVAVIVMTLVVGVSGYLTYVGKIDGSTFAFLLGLIVGYALTFIRDAINPPKA